MFETLILRKQVMENCFNISLRGTKYVVSSSAVRNFMETLSKRDYNVVNHNGDYFVDRNPLIFHKILDYLSVRKLHLPKGMCAIKAKEELEFWAIPIDAVPNCCYGVLFDDNLSSFEAIEKTEKHLVQDVSPKDEKGVSESKLQRFRDVLNIAAEDPFSCLLGKIWLFLSAVLTVTTVVCFLLNTLDDYRVDRVTIPEISDNETYNFFYSNPKRKLLITKAVPSGRLYVEGSCNTVLLLDLLFRFVMPRQKKVFLLSISNIIELVACVMCFLVIKVDLNPEMIINNLDLNVFVMIIGGLYSLRALKLLQLAESTAEMRILKLCFQNSWKTLCFLVLVFTIFSLIFGCGMFWAEFNNADTFPNMPISIWWAIVTITTVGYGDFYPKSAFGYIMASVTAMIGLSLIAIPIATLSSNFNTFYTCYTYRKKYILAKKKSKLITVSPVH